MNPKAVVLSVLTALTFGSAQAQHLNSCPLIFAGESVPYFDRAQPRAKVDFSSIESFVREFRRQNIYGKVTDYFDRDLDTQVYFANNAVPNRMGKRDFVDPESKAVVIFLHGSGTVRSSGKNFIHLMNTLAAHNVSSVAVDLPFHANGSLSNKFNDPKYVTAWLNKIVEKARMAGVPIYFAGHSFGPSLIMEYLYDYPRTVDGALLISPVAFNKELRDWSDTETSRMRFGSDPVDPLLGGIWGDRMINLFRSHNDPKSGDPTLINPDLKIKVLTGSREEYAPGPLGGRKNLPVGDNTYSIPDAIRRVLSRALVTVEDGVGHYIFQHKDKRGNNVVLREVFDLVGIDIQDAPKIKTAFAKHLTESRPMSAQLWHKYHTDRLFKSWADNAKMQVTLQRILDNRDEVRARRILDSYRLTREDQEKRVIEHLIALATRTPELAQAYKAAIEDIRSKGLSDSPLFDLLQENAKD